MVNYLERSNFLGIPFTRYAERRLAPQEWWLAAVTGWLPILSSECDLWLVTGRVNGRGVKGRVNKEGRWRDGW